MAKTKKQLREYNRKAQRKHRLKEKLSGEGTVRPATGIENENQIDSVIREMAESQVSINSEKTLSQHRISLIQKYSDEMIEPHFSRLMFWEAKLRKFVKEQQCKRFFRRYRFGTLSYFNGKLQIKLNVDLAKRMMGKP